MKRFRFRRGLGAAGGLVLLLAGLPFVGTALAETVACGQTITANTTLTADVGPCEGDGVIIGADNITLNLNGHRVFGTPGPGDGNGAGIRLPQRTGVSIAGTTQRSGTMGSVSDFDAGVVINGGSGNNIGRLIVEDNVSHADADPPGSTNFTATLGDGIVLFSSAGNTIRENVVRRNGIYDNIAVLGQGSDDNLIRGNIVSDAVGTGLSDFSGVGQGIILNPTIAAPPPAPAAVQYRNRMLNNVITSNAGAGILNANNIDGSISRNRISGNGVLASQGGDGIDNTVTAHVSQDTNMLISDNEVSGNAEGGISASAFSTVARGSRVLRNEVTANGEAGIVVTDNSLVQGNTVSHNLARGIRGAGNNITVADNQVGENGGDGIEFAMQNNTNNKVLRNEVHRNDGGGIVVIFGIDNEILDNNASDNVLGPSSSSSTDFLTVDFGSRLSARDLYNLDWDDFEAYIAQIIAGGSFDNLELLGCGTNEWFGNTWGSGGYFPECVTAGGSGPAAAAAGATSSEAAPASASTGDLLERTAEAPAPPPPSRRAPGPVAL